MWRKYVTKRAVEARGKREGEGSMIFEQRNATCVLWILH